MNRIIEILFENYLNTDHTGDVAEELHKISAEIDRQIEAGDVDANAIGDYELAAARLGFYEGFKMGLELAMGRQQEPARRAA